MKKIIVIGCPGSGKSTFALALYNKTNIPVYHLDMMFWNKDRTTIKKEIFFEKLSNIMDKDIWIIDGNYSSSMEMRMEKCDTVFFLDYPLEVCLEGVRERRGRARVDIPWIETEEDYDFIDFIKRFDLEQRPMILDLLKKYNDKDIVIFKSREESEKYLNNMPN